MPPKGKWFDDGFQARRLRALPHVPGQRLPRPGGAAGPATTCRLGSASKRASHAETCPTFLRPTLHPVCLAAATAGSAAHRRSSAALPPYKATGVSPASGCRREGKTGGGQRSSAFRRIRRCQPCHALAGQGDHPASPRDALQDHQLAGPNAARVTPIATGVAAVAVTLAHRPHHDIQPTGASHSQSFRQQGGGSQETDEFGVRSARRTREQRQGLALPVKIMGQPDRVTARLLPADAPGTGNCDNRGQPPIEVTCQGADGLGRVRRTRLQDDCFHHLPRIPASQTAICRPSGGPGSAVVIRPGVRASASEREVERLVPCTFQGPGLDDGLGPKSIQPPGGPVHQHVSTGARNSLKQQKAARSEGSGDQWPGPQSHPVKPPPSSGENRLDGIPGVGGHVRRGSSHGQRRHSPFPDKPSNPPLVEAKAQLHYPSSSWECSAADSRCRG